MKVVTSKVVYCLNRYQQCGQIKLGKYQAQRNSNIWIFFIEKLTLLSAFLYRTWYRKLHISRIWWDLEKNPSYVKIRVMWNVYGFTSKCKDKIVAIKQTSFLWKLSSEKANLRMNEWCSSLRMTGYQLNGFIFSLDWFFAYEIAVHVWTDKINSSKKTVAVSIFFTATFHKHPFCLQNNA